MKMTIGAALAALAGGLLAGQRDDCVVSKDWAIRPVCGRTLYSSFRPEGWARTWENVPDLPMMRNVFLTFDFSKFPISTIVPDKDEFLRFRRPEERWQRMPAKFDDVMDTFNDYMKKAMAAFWKHRPGMPFTLYLGADGREPFRLDRTYGPDVEDVPSYLAWKAKHPSFAGFSFLDELDSDMMYYVGRYKKIKDPKVREAVHSAFPVTRDPGRNADWADEAVRRSVARHFGEKMQSGLYSCVLTTGHDLMRNGCGPVWYEAELGYTSSPWRWGGMFVRGAGRQFGQPWGWYCATLLDGWRTRDGKPPERAETSFIEWPSPFWPYLPREPVKYKGCSRSLLARNIMYGYFIGASIIKLEKAWEFLCAYGPDGKTPVLSPYGEDFNRPFRMEFDEGFDRGVVYSPVALLVSDREPQRRDNYTGNKDLFTMPAFMMTLVPTFEKDPGRYRDPEKGDQGCLWNSEFGEFCDVLCPDVPNQDDKAFYKVLKNYKQAFLVGHFERDRLRLRALAEFVKRGGVLYAEKKQVEQGLVPTAPKGAKGKVVVVDRYLPDYYYTSKDSWFPTMLGKLSSGEIPCPVIRDLLRKAQDETMPVTVEGDIQWGVNRTKTGWLVWLMNNKGVTKYLLEPEELDPRATSHVKVTFKPTGKVYEADVAAGQWATIEIR